MAEPLSRYRPPSDELVLVEDGQQVSHVTDTDGVRKCEKPDGCIFGYPSSQRSNAA